MPPVVRLNRKDLIEWIESIEAGGGDATALRRELEELGPWLYRSRPIRGRSDRFEGDQWG